jgi:TRAP-type C4-dicarboxylate transport system substrate-binding protein
MWQKKVNERAKGELTIEYLGGPEVIPVIDQPMAAKKGVVDIAFTFGGSPLVPEGNTLFLSRVGNEEEREQGYWDLLGEAHKNVGLYFLGRDRDIHPGGYFRIWVNKKVARPQDLVGMKIGGLTPVYVPYLKALGVVPTLLAIPDVYTAVERGVIDGYILGGSLPVSLGLHEVTKYRIEHRYYRPDVVYVFNLDVWNKLPQHLKDLLTKAQREVEKEIMPIGMKVVEGAWNAELAAGQEIITFSAEDAKWYVETAYQSAWESYFEEHPDWAPKFYQAMEK